MLTFLSQVVYSQCQTGNCKDGFGKKKYQGAIYHGYFDNYKMDSIGQLFYDDGRKYLGELNQDTFGGFGFFQWKNGANYIGYWKNNKQNGLGIEKNTSGTITNAGIWTDGKITAPLNSDPQKNNPKNCTGNCVNGVGKLVKKDSTIFLGIFKKKKITFGIIKNEDYYYNGEIQNNLPHGKGQVKFLKTNTFYNGDFFNGKMHGSGIHTDVNHNKTHGTWIENVYQDPSKFKYIDKDFCNELIALAKLSKEEYDQLEVEKKGVYSSTLKKKFLNTFQIIKKESLADLFSGGLLTVTLPETKKEPTIKNEELKKSCKSCKKLKASEFDDIFYYNDVKITLINNYIKIAYPKPSPCLSGNCKNGKGKIQFNNSVYEGKFKDGQPHGKGIEKWKNGSKFEGEYLNGVRDGYGIYTWSKESNTSRYEGNFKDGQRHGQGTYHWKNGAKYVGEQKKGKFDGKGIEYASDGKIIYDGYWKNSKFHGQGTRNFNDGQYTGQWANGKKNGKGIILYHKGDKHIGEWKDDLLIKGSYYDKNGKVKYEGDFNNGFRHGKGKVYFESGIYEGDIVKNILEGKGTIKYDNGNSYTGDWKDGNFNGKGTYKWKVGNSYTGDYVNGNREGKGTYTWAEGSYLIGEFKNNKPHGKCTEYRKDRTKAFEGTYVNGKAEGYGKLYDKNGKITYEGQFKNGKKAE